MGHSLLPPRRWYGLLCLILGGFMLLWGQTLLKDHLVGKSFIVYWTLCFLVTGAALIISLWDTHRLRRMLREQEKELFKRMVDQVEEARREKNQDRDASATEDPTSRA